MSSCSSRRVLAVLTLALLLTPSLALARPQARTDPARVATMAQPGLFALFRTGLAQLLAKVTTGTTGTGTGASGSGDGGAGVRIDPEGYQASPAPPPAGHP